MTVEAIFSEEFPKGHFGDPEFPSGFDEVEQVIAGSLWTGKEELSNRAGMPRQQFSIRPSAQAVLNLPDDLRRRELAMPKRGTITDAHQASNLSDFQIRVTSEQKVAGDPATGVIAAGLLQEPEGAMQQSSLFVRESLRRDLSGLQPLFECPTFRGHLGASSLVAESKAAEV
jgi:hypothetical protein